MNVNGKVSYFGGPSDPTDSGHTANGETTKTPGIAVYNHGTLNGYWRVTAPNGKTVVLKQTDIGPAPFTGRKIDVTYSALGKFGYGEHNFPTDSEFKATYLGRNAGQQAQEGQQAQATTEPPRAPSRGLPGVTATPTQGFDQAGFQKAQKAAVLGKLLASEKGASENPLLLTGLATTKAPARSEYTTEGQAPKLPGAQPQPQALPQAPAQGGTKLGGFLPGNAPLKVERIDQGQDIATNPGGAIIAPGDGVVVAVKDNPGGFGERYPIVRFTSGPLAGKTVYIGHTHSTLPVGAQFKAGQPLSHTGYGTPKEGNARTPGWAEIGLWGPNGPGGMEAGKQIAPYLTRKK